MSILLTGGAGYIGSHAALDFLNSGYEVVIIDNFCNSQQEAIKRISDLSGKKVSFYKVDLLNRGQLDEVFSKHKLKAVVHFAGLKAVGESVSDPLKYYENNVSGTIHLLSIMTKYNVKKLVFSSSATVYGLQDQVPIHESASLSATNPYGRTKLIIEEMLRDIYTADSSWRIALLRYFNPTGAHESGLIGENPNGEPDNLMPYITQVAIGKREKLSVFGNDYQTKDGTGVRDYIHVMDLVRGHIKALEYLENHSGIDVFNLGTGRGYSVLDLIKTFRAESGVDIPFVYADRRPGDVGEVFADAKKAKEKLDWTATKTLQDMCRDSWNWQKKNPNGYESGPPSKNG